MKIVDVCEFYSPDGGGVRTYIEGKLRSAERLGQEVVVIAPGARDETRHVSPSARIHFVRAPRLPVDPRYFMFWDAAPVHRLLDAESPDVLEASSPWRGAWIAAGWKGPATRALFMHHDPLSVFAYQWLHGIAAPAQADKVFAWLWDYLRRLAAHFVAVVCPSPSLAERLAAKGIEAPLTIALGVDAGVFSPLHRDQALRAELLARCALPPDAALLLGVGRHTPEKRWPCLIDAVQQVGRERPVGFVLVGAGHDQAKSLARIGENPHIQALAPIRDRPRLAAVMASADVLLHGSAAETFGLVVAEAIASGLPVIAPDMGAAADLARAAPSEIYATGDRRAAAAAIRRLLDRDPSGLRAASLRAAAGARTLDDHFDDLFAAYEAAVGARAPKMALRTPIAI